MQTEIGKISAKFTDYHTMHPDIKNETLISELNSLYFLSEPGEVYWGSLKVNKTIDMLTIEEFGCLLIYNYKKEKFEISGTSVELLIIKIRYAVQKRMAADPEFRKKARSIIG